MKAASALRPHHTCVPDHHPRLIESTQWGEVRRSFKNRLVQDTGRLQRNPQGSVAVSDCRTSAVPD
jgi:hypothetical protein